MRRIRPNPIGSLSILGFIVIHLFSCNGVKESRKVLDVDLIINHINIIDPVNKRILDDQTILIKGDTIVDVFAGSSEKFDLSDSLIINGENRHVISGFWNMHTHICWQDNLDKELFPILLSIWDHRCA